MFLRSKFRWYLFLFLEKLYEQTHICFVFPWILWPWIGTLRYCLCDLCLYGRISWKILGSFRQFFRWLNMSHFRPKDELDDCSLLSPVPMKNDGFRPALKIWVITTRNLQKRGGFPIVYSYTIFNIFLFNVNIFLWKTCFVGIKILFVSESTETKLQSSTPQGDLERWCTAWSLGRVGS